MADDVFLRKLKEGVTAWNEWRPSDPNFRADLTGADLSHANHLTQDQLNSACIRKGGKPPTLPEDLKPPQKVCVPWWKPR